MLLDLSALESPFQVRTGCVTVVTLVILPKDLMMAPLMERPMPTVVVELLRMGMEM